MPPIPCPLTEPLLLTTTWGLPAGDSEPGLSMEGEEGRGKWNLKKGEGDGNRA